MKNCKYSRSHADKVSVKGVVIGDRIQYVNDDGDDVFFDVEKCLKLFEGKEVAFSISTKNDEDCTEDLTEDNDD